MVTPTEHLRRLDAAIARQREALDELIAARAALAGEPAGGLTEAEIAEIDERARRTAARLRGPGGVR